MRTVRVHASRYCAWLAIFVCAGACRAAATHDLSIEQLSAVIARDQASLDPCYQSALDKTPYDQEFKIQTTLHIRKDGSVAKVELDQQGLRGIGPCLVEAIKAWQFPSAADETHARLPIIFRPKVERTLSPDVKLPPGFKVVQPP
jgi:hypothetical protein